VSAGETEESDREPTLEFVLMSDAESTTALGGSASTVEFTLVRMDADLEQPVLRRLLGKLQGFLNRLLQPLKALVDSGVGGGVRASHEGDGGEGDQEDHEEEEDQVARQVFPKPLPGGA